MKNIGILGSMSWNSNNWEEMSSDQDIIKSNFDYVKEHGFTHEDLNFGQNIYPLEDDGTYIAYCPQFNTLPSLEESKYVDIVFLKSQDYRDKKNQIVGFYAFPQIGNFDRREDCADYDNYSFGNIKSTPENIVRFENSITVDDSICALKGYLPKGKKLGKQGYNYLDYNNVMKILDEATRLNPTNTVISKVKYKFLTEKKYKF